VAVIFEDDDVAREPVGALEVLCDEPGSGVGSGKFGEPGRRSWTLDTEGLSTGMSVASTGGLVGSIDGWLVDFGAGGGMDGRIGFGLWTGGVSCCSTWRM